MPHPRTPLATAPFDQVELGRMPYVEAFERQREALERVVAARNGTQGSAGVVMTVEHPAVITVSRRAAAGAHVLATPEVLSRLGVEVCETDRGGDVTYHGPGQLVVYPILDLSLLNVGIHDYMRMLEQAIIDTCGAFGVGAERDPAATGVWVRDSSGELAKIAALGVRVRKWVSMHGLAINITTDMAHFGLIVPCGLTRPVTSLSQLLGDRCPSWAVVRATLLEKLAAQVTEKWAAAEAKRSAP